MWWLIDKLQRLQVSVLRPAVTTNGWGLVGVEATRAVGSHYEVNFLFFSFYLCEMGGDRCGLYFFYFCEML